MLAVIELLAVCAVFWPRGYTLETLFFSKRIPPANLQGWLLIRRESVAVHFGCSHLKAKNQSGGYFIQTASVKWNTNRSSLWCINKYWKITFIDPRSPWREVAAPRETTQAVIIEGNLNACECSATASKSVARFIFIQQLAVAGNGMSKRWEVDKFNAWQSIKRSRHKLQTVLIIYILSAVPALLKVHDSLFNIFELLLASIDSGALCADYHKKYNTWSYDMCTRRETHTQKANRIPLYQSADKRNPRQQVLLVFHHKGSCQNGRRRLEIQSILLRLFY